MERLKSLSWSLPGLLVWLLAVGLASSRLTVAWGIASALVGTILGFVLSLPLSRTRLRLPVLWVIASVAEALVLASAGWMRGGDLLPRLIGPVATYYCAEMFSWLWTAAIVVAVLMASSRRLQATLVVEVGVVAAIFAGLLASHRDGLISRPHFLVDPLWARGYDPLPVFLALGAALAGVLVLLLSSRQPERRSCGGLALLMALIVGVFLLLPTARLKDLPQLRKAFERSGGTPTPAAAASPSTPGDGPNGGSPPPGQGPNGGSPSPGEDPNGGTLPSPGATGGPRPSPSGREKGGRGQGDRQEDPVQELEKREASGRGNPPVAVVLLGDDYSPPEGYYYFRQAAFSQFNGQSLVRDQSGRYDLDCPDAFPEGTVPVRLPAFEPYLRTPLDTTVALLIPHNHPFGLVDAASMSSADNPDPRRFQRAYQVRSMVGHLPLRSLLGRKAGAPEWTAAAWRHYTQAPSDPRYARLATEATAGLRAGYATDALARALAIRVLLEKTGTYDLNVRYETTGDPVSSFLFGPRVGYCVHFARAAVALFRSIGLPARLGTGYAVSARNRGSGAALMLRASDAHAWPEIYLEGAGWVIVDIAPEKSNTPPVPPPDQDTQQMMGEMARKKSARPEADEKPAGQGDVQEAMREKVRWVISHAWLLLFGLLGLYGVKAWRRVSPRFCAGGGDSRLYYRAALDVLMESGRGRRYGQTREGFARDQEAVSPAFSRLTRIHLEDTLGGPGGTGRSREELSQLYQAVTREVAASTSLLRRVAGWLDPVAWWRVR